MWRVPRPIIRLALAALLILYLVPPPSLGDDDAATTRPGSAASAKALSVVSREEYQRRVSELPVAQPTDRYAVVIGVDEFSDPAIPHLSACASDAQSIYEVLTDPIVGMFPPDHVKLLVNKEATRVNVVDALDHLTRCARKDDLVVIYFSGHGTVDLDGTGYWVVHDTLLNKLRATGVPQTDVTQLINNIPSERMVVVIDACNSAATAEMRAQAASKSLAGNKIYPAQGQGRVILTASNGQQQSLTILNGDGAGHSVFTYYLLQGLKGAAARDPDGAIIVTNLFHYAAERTRERARELGGEQDPSMRGTVEADFLLAVNPQAVIHGVQQTQSRRELLAQMRAAKLDGSMLRWIAKLLDKNPYTLDRNETRAIQLMDDLIQSMTKAVTVSGGSMTASPAQLQQLIVELMSIQDPRRGEEIDRTLSQLRAALDLGDLGAAKTWIEALTRLVPDHPELKELSRRFNIRSHIAQLWTRADAAAGAGRLDEQLVCLDEIITLSHANWPAEEARAVARKRAVQISHWQEQAESSLQAGRLDEALQYIHNILDIDPQNPGVIRLMPRVEQAKKQREQIFDALAEARQALIDKDFSRAQAAVNRVLKIDPKNAPALELLAQIQARSSSDPQKVKAAVVSNLLDKARAQLQSGEFLQAWRTLDSISAIQEDNADARELRTAVRARWLASAQALATPKNARQALAVLEQILTEAPDDTEAKALRDRVRAEYLNPKRWTNSLSMLFIRIEPGKFVMGSNHPQNIREYPPHEIQLTRRFYMADTPVTRRQFREFIEATRYITDAEAGGFAWHLADNPQSPTSYTFVTQKGLTWKSPGFEQGDDEPVVCVSYRDAEAFCRWLSKRENQVYRLPTEIEWEYAARAGATGEYIWGDTVESGKGYFNAYDTTTGDVLKLRSMTAFPFSDGYAHTAPVGKFKPNAWGLHDMCGNVWQWTSTYYQQTPYPASTTPLVDPPNPRPDDLNSRSIRGGGWHSNAEWLRVAFRSFAPQDFREFSLGFRVVRQIED